MKAKDVYKLIPKEFTLVNHTITVSVEERVNLGDGEVYGCYSSEKLMIRIALNIDETELNKEQILNTFMHELTHCFLFFLGMGQDEMLAQGMANLLREYETSKVLE